MIRIRPYRCGFGDKPAGSTRSLPNGYYCERIGELDPVFTGSPNADTMLERTSTNLQRAADRLLINNYNNVPAHVRGFVMSGVPVMSSADATKLASATAVAEKVCYSSDTGKGSWKYTTAKNKDIAIEGNVETSAYSADKDLTKEPIAISGSTNKFTPGLLEPMLDTDFSPVPNMGLSSIDAALDGIAVALAVLGQWKTSVVSNITNIDTGKSEGSSKPVPPSNNGCKWGFFMSLDGTTYKIGSEPSDLTYDIESGSVSITGADGTTTVAVSGKSGSVRGSMKFYVVIPFRETASDCYMACVIDKDDIGIKASPGTGNCISFCIGGITRSTGKTDSGQTIYSYSVDSNPNCEIAFVFDKLCAGVSDFGYVIESTDSSLFGGGIPSVVMARRQ